MKCVRIAEWHEQHGEEPPGTEWEGLLAHSQHCPDCSLYLKMRGKIFEAMKTMPPPEMPGETTELILRAVDLSEESPSKIEEASTEWIDYLLSPLQYATTAACVLMIAFNFSSSQKSEIVHESNPQKISTQRVAAIPRPEPVKRRQGESLVRLSDKEISDFMKKLQEYRRLHPEMEAPSQPNMPAELATFNDK